MSELNRRYPADFMTFSGLNFKGDEATPPAEGMTKRGKPLTEIGKKRVHTKRLRATIKDLHVEIEKRQQSVRPNIALIPGIYGPARNDGPNS